MFTRWGRSITISLLLMIVLGAGCRSSANSGLITNRGITYVFTGATLTKQSIDNGDVLVQTDAYTFQNRGNHLVLNGRPCGIVKDGDKVEVKDKGKVFINGLPR